MCSRANCVQSICFTLVQPGYVDYDDVDVDDDDDDDKGHECSGSGHAQ